MSNKKIEDYNHTFPSPYAPNSEKESDAYALATFKAVLDATSQYRESRSRQTDMSRAYARGLQSLRQYLDEMQIEGDKQWVNIDYTPSRIAQKFEKIVVDDYQQLKEKVKAFAKAYHIQERKEKRKTDLRFRMEFGQQIQGLEEALGFPIEDPNIKVPEDDEELDLISSLNSDEREELLMREMVDKVLKDNDIESMKRQFLSDIFQVNFAGYHHYTKPDGSIGIDFVSTEDALFDSFNGEIGKNLRYAGKATTMTISEIRSLWAIPQDKEEQLYNLAHTYKNDYGNWYLLGSSFKQDWRYAGARPYDDFTVPVFHIWRKTLKNVGYLEGKDGYGKSVFDIDNNITSFEKRSDGRKQTGVAYPETSYEGWFAGNVKCPVVLEWGESVNQTRTGKEKQQVLCPYIYFMPENRGTLMEMSAVERIIPEIKTMDLSMLRIKLTLANHPPVGYAVDPQALMDIDLGDGTLSPLDIQDIYQQTGKLYVKRQKDDGMVDNNLPIVPLNISIADTINTYITVYNIALNNIRDILGINPNREGTANLSRVSNAVAQSAIAVSQTATYYIYRSFTKATEELVKQLGIRILDVLKYGNPHKGYLSYLGQENIDFIKERDEILASNYEFIYDPQMTKEEEERLVSLVNAGVSARELSVPDALLILSIKDVGIAEKYLRYIYKKNEKETHQRNVEMQTAQAQAQGDMAVRAEEAKRETFAIQSELQSNEWKVKGENSDRVAIMEIAKNALQAQQDGKAITPREQELISLVIDNAITTLEKSMLETEQQLQAHADAEQVDMITQQVGQAVESGQMTEEEGLQALHQSGVPM